MSHQVPTQKYISFVITICFLFRILKSFDIAVSDSGDEGEKRKGGGGKKGEEGDGKKGEGGLEDEMALRGLATLLGDQPEQQTRIQVH
jgi:hypothetical protein